MKNNIKNIHSRRINDFSKKDFWKFFKIFFTAILAFSLILSLFLSSGIAFAKESNYEGYINGFSNKNTENKTIDNSIVNKLTTAINNFDSKQSIFKYYENQNTFINTLDSIESEYPEMYQFSINGTNGGETNWLFNHFLLSINFNYLLTKKEYSNSLKSIQDIKNNIVEATKNMSEYDKEKYIYDYIARNVTYENSNPNNSTIYGVFIENKANCTGLSKAFKYLANACGLQCVVVGGYQKDNSNDGHSWNKIKLGNKWYVVDLNKELNCYDIYPNKNPENYPLSYPSFNVTDQEESDFKVSDIYKIAPHSKSYNEEYYRKSDMYLTEDNASEIINKIVAQLSKTGTSSIRANSKATLENIESKTEDIQIAYYDKTGEFIGLQYYTYDDICYFFVDKS